MSQHEFSSYSSSSTGGDGTGGFDAAKAIFSQVDANHDGSIDRNEFQQWATGASQSSGGAQYESKGLFNSGAAGNFDSSSFESSGYSLAGAAGESDGSNFHTAKIVRGNVLESTVHHPDAGGFEGSNVSQAGNYTAEMNAAWSRYGAEVRGAGLYVDSNPQVIRRPAAGGVQTYTQNIKVRFLQPPPVPPPGVSHSLRGEKLPFFKN